MVLHNPTESTVSIVLDGATYSVAPLSSVEVSTDVASRWTKVHGFLQASESVAEVKEDETEVEPVEVKEEVKEEEVTTNEPEVVVEEKETVVSKLVKAVKGKK